MSKPPAQPGGRDPAPAARKLRTAQTLPPAGAPTGRGKSRGASKSAPPQAESAKAKSAAAAQNAEDAPPPEEGEAIGRFDFLHDAPSWLTSAIVHAVLLLVLALWTLAPPAEDIRTALFSSITDSQEKPEELDSPIEVDLELEEISLPTDNFDPGEAALGEMNVLADAAVDMTTGVGDLDDSTSLEIGALFGDDGQAMAQNGDGAGGAKFFGTVSQGTRFVFVIDNSNSMGAGKFETVANELVKSIDALGPRQQFYIILFSDSPYGMFHPRPASYFITGTQPNKYKVRAWLSTVQLCLRTKAEEAMQRAFALRPDVIYILGDGAFTDNTTQILTRPHDRRVVIHTLLMAGGGKAAGKGSQQLMAIAKANKGTFRNVNISPEARAAAKKNPIPKNNTRGKVWGLKLPAK